MTWEQPGGEHGDRRPPEDPGGDVPPPPPPGYGEPPAAPGYGTPPPPAAPPPAPYGAPPAQEPAAGQPPYDGQPQYGQPQYGQPQYGSGQPEYGQPPTFGQPPAYGQPPVFGQPPTYGQPPAFGQGYGFGPVGLPAGAQYAEWGTRLGAYLLDSLVTLGTSLPALISLGIGAATAPDALDGSSGSPLPGLFVGLFFLLLLLPLAFVIWNTYRTGATGQSLGKGWMGIHLVSTRTMQPPGPGTAFGKYVLRGVINQVTCGIYIWVTGLWPLWDAQKQSLDDKIVSTYVVRFPGNRLP